MFSVAKLRNQGKMQILVLWFALLVSVLSAHGCRKSSGAVPVHGRVTYQGQPLANATLTFFPASGRPVDAAISDGDYRTALLPGDYTSVVNIAVDMPQGYGRTHWNQLPPQKFTLPETYTARTKSRLKAVVKAEQNEPIDF